MTLTNNLVILRIKLNVSCETLSYILEEKNVFVGRSTLQAWENGRNQPHLLALKALSEIYCVTIDQLAFGDCSKVNIPAYNGPVKYESKRNSGAQIIAKKISDQKLKSNIKTN